MAAVPSTLNHVGLKLKDDVNNDVDPRLVNALKAIIRPGYPNKNLIVTLTISSLFDSHEDKPNSRHNQKKAVDISRINGKPVAQYGHDDEMKEFVQRVQTEFEKVAGRRENFGPYFKRKNGHSHNVPGHNDHIHLSVD